MIVSTIPPSIEGIDETRFRRPTLDQTRSFLQAMLLSPRVSKEVEQQRLAICEKCEKRKVPTDGSPPYCGLCNCKVSMQGYRINDLTHYEENLPKWGCKIDHRGWLEPDGKHRGWPLF